MKKKNKAFYTAQLICAAAGGVCFCILYFAFAIQKQSPDNHLPIYNFFGIFFKDMFTASVITQITGAVCFIMLILTAFRDGSRISAGSVILSLLLAAFASQVCSVLGANFHSMGIAGFALQLLTQLAAIYINTAVLYYLNKGKGCDNNDCEI